MRKQTRWSRLLTGALVLVAVAALLSIADWTLPLGAYRLSLTSASQATGLAQVSGDSSPDAIDGVPYCADHDPTRWHGLVERAESGEIRCTYGHEHKDNPHELDDKFGPPAYEISHPWETPLENEHKHNAYAWYVVRDQPCVNKNTSNLGFSDLRIQLHADGHKGALTRIHSYSLEAQACDENDPEYTGFLKIGGHLDFGRLMLSGQRLPLPADQHPDCGTLTDRDSNRRLHMALGGKFDGAFTWYGTNSTCHLAGGDTRLARISNVGVLQEDWGPIDPNSPNDPLLFHGTINGKTFNGSWAERIHLLSLQIRDDADGLDGRRDGYANFKGYANRYGEVVRGCGAPSLDCVPVEARNLKVGYYEFRQYYLGLGGREYDVKGPSGQSLIQYPSSSPASHHEAGS